MTARQKEEMEMGADKTSKGASEKQKAGNQSQATLHCPEGENLDSMSEPLQRGGGAKKEKKSDLSVAFENAFCKESSAKLWNDVGFSIEDVKPKSKFVAWIDIMGSKRTMTNALRNATIFVGTLHSAVLAARVGFKNVSIHAMTDGVYVVADSFEQVRNFVVCVMRSCAKRYCEINGVGFNHFFVRAAIAYGKIIDCETMSKSIEKECNDFESYTHNVMLGVPFVKANVGESEAPPYGIYIDESIRTQTDDAEGNVSWVLHRWWSSKDYNQKQFAAAFARALLDQLKWLESNRLSTFFPVEKKEKYEHAIREYFEL